MTNAYLVEYYTIEPKTKTTGWTIEFAKVIAPTARAARIAASWLPNFDCVITSGQCSPHLTARDIGFTEDNDYDLTVTHFDCGINLPDFRCGICGHTYRDWEAVEVETVPVPGEGTVKEWWCKSCWDSVEDTDVESEHAHGCGSGMHGEENLEREEEERLYQAELRSQIHPRSN